MPRLIDADALVEYFEALARSLANVECFAAADATQTAAETLKLASTIDAEPVRHGRWELETSKYLRRCSACEKVTLYRGAGRHYDYCPNCGATMDLEVQHDHSGSNPLA